MAPFGSFVLLWIDEVSKKRSAGLEAVKALAPDRKHPKYYSGVHSETRNRGF